MVYGLIPHFSIRLLSKLDECEYDLENNFEIYRNLSQVLLKVVSLFRKYLLCRSSIPLDKPVDWLEESKQADPDIFLIKIEEPNYDHFNKETVMMGVILLSKKLKEFPSKEAFAIYDNLQLLHVALFKLNYNEYVIDKMRESISILIGEQPNQLIELLFEHKLMLVNKIVARLIDLLENRQDHHSHQNHQHSYQVSLLVDNIFEQAVDFVASQSSIQSQQMNGLMEKLFIYSRGRRAAIKTKFFNVFEKFYGPSLFRKFQYFFSKHLIDDMDKVLFFQSSAQILDISLNNFKTDLPLEKIRNTAKLFAFKNPALDFQNSHSAFPETNTVKGKL